MFGVLKNYFSWHYTVAYVDQMYIFKNYVWFLLHFFSVKEMLKSMISPWRRLQEEKGSLVNHPGDFFAALIVNTIMRIVGFFIRTGLLIVATFCLIVLIFLVLTVFVFWTALPFVVPYFFIKGIILFPL